jgi:ferrous iron transport protein B
MLVFSLLYTPCVAAVASIRREMGRKWALIVVVWQCSLAWIFAVLVQLISRLFGLS